LKPYFETDSVKIYHGDCREVIADLPDVDLVLTDPPYGIKYIAGHRTKHDKLRKAIANDESLDVMAEMWPLVMGKLKDERHWYAFASPRMIDAAMRVCTPKQVLCWDKGDRGTVGDLTCGFGEAWEAILYGITGRRPLNGKRPRSVIRQDWSGTMDPVHPTVKPVKLLEILINWSSHPGELVLDPFCGSGTTLMAAKLLGRKSIGIEIEEKYCEVSADRLRQGVLPFGD